MNTIEQKIISYPYPGLRAFGTDESEIFFGRDEHIDDLLARLQRGRFLGVIGPSGCGKSSLIRAGMIPALQGGLVARAGSNWQVAVMRPGAQPLQSLAHALRHSTGADEALADTDGFLHAVLGRGPLGLADALAEYGFADTTNLLLLVDQFEELFRVGLGDDCSEARAFVDLLLTSARVERFPIHVVLTMRSDFLGHCPVFRGLPEALNDSQYLTPRLNREQQRLAIEGPAAMFNAEIRPEVVNRILNAMGADPDQLPLMQHLLMRMWRTERLKVPDPEQAIEITVDTYREVGGLQDCVSMHADRIYRSFTGEEARIAELLFRQVTEVASDSRLVRRPRRYAELCSKLAPTESSAERTALRTVLDAFRREGRTFLMPPVSDGLTADTLIDISHESVIRQWDRLKQWAWDEHRIGRVRKMVAEKAGRWKEHRDDEGYLLYGVEFAEAKAWRDKYPEQVGGDEGDLLKASIKREQEEVDRLKSRNRKYLLLALVALVFALFAVFFAMQAQSSKEEEVKAAFKTAISEARAAAALEETKAEKQEKNRHARAMINTCIGNGVRQLDANRMDQALIWFAEAFARDKKISTPDDKQYLDRAAIHQMRLAAVLERCPKVQEILWHDRPVTLAEFSCDGKHLVTVADEGPAKIWALGTGGQPRTLSDQTVNAKSDDKKSVRHAAFSADGGYVVTAEDRAAVVWEVASGKRVRAFSHDQVRRAAFSPDGRFLVTVSRDKTARLWNAHSGERLAVLPHTGFVYFAAFSPDSKRVVTASADDEKTVRIWDVLTGNPLTKPLPNPDYVLFASFSPSGDRVVTAAKNGEVRILEAAAGAVVGNIGSHNGPVDRATFTPDGSRVLTVSASGAQLWNAITGTALALPAKSYLENNPAFSPEGRFQAFFLASMDHAIQVRDRAPAKPRRVGLGTLSAASFQHPGNRLITVSTDKVLHLWDVVNGKAQAVPLKDCGEAKRAWLSPSGQRILTIHDDNSARPLSVASTVALSGSHAGQGPLLAASALLAGGTGRPAKVWDASKGKAMSELLPHPSTIQFAAFSRAGDRVVTIGEDRVVRTWDPATGTARGVFSGHSDVVEHAAFSPDGKVVISSGQDGKAHLWEADTGNPLPGPPLEHKGHVHSAAFSPDGRRVVTVSSDKTACVWEPAANKLPIAMFRHSGKVLEASFSQDGKRVMTVGNDWSVRIWDVESQSRTTPPMEHKHLVKRAGFSPDGLCVLTVTDQYARVWDAATGEPVTPLLDQLNLLDAAFSPDGSMVITAGKDGTIQWWDLSRDQRAVEDLLRLAKLISRHQVNPDRAWLEPCLSVDLRKHWHAIWAEYSREYQRSQEAAGRAWHHQEAKDAEDAKQWKVALLHLAKLPATASGQTSLWKRQGRAFWELGQWEKAVAEYTKALHEKADDVDALYNRGRAYARLGQFDAARMDYDKAILHNPEDGSVYLARSVVNAHLCNLDAGKADYDEALLRSAVRFPRVDCTWINRSIGLSPLRRDHWEEVKADCSREIDARDEKPQEGSPDGQTSTETRAIDKWPYYRNRGLANAVLRYWPQAAADFKQAAALKGDDWSVWQGAARSFAETGGWVDAEFACHSAIRWDSKKKDWGSYYLLGLAQSQRQAHSEAVGSFSEAIDKGGAIGWSVWFQRGYARHLSQDYGGAIDDYCAVIGMKEVATAFNNRAVAYKSTGDDDNAKADYTNAIRLDSRSFLYRRNLGNLYRQVREYDKAIAEYDEAIRLNPQYTEVFAGRGEAHFKRDAYPPAVADYSEAIRLNPNEAAYYAKRGQVYQKQGEIKKASDDYIKALSVDPGRLANASRVSAASCLASLATKEGRANQVEEALGRVVGTHENLASGSAQRQNLAWAYENLAVFLHYNGQLSKAEGACGKALALRQQLADEEHKDKLRWGHLAFCHERLGNILLDANRPAEGTQALRKALASREKTAVDFRSAENDNLLAWFLATCPVQELRDGKRAVELADKAVKQAQWVGNNWNTLGVAHYRVGAWTASKAALERSMELTSGGTLTDWFFLAMAHKQLGNETLARHWYDKAVEDFERDQETEQTRRFRAEAAALLGLTRSTPKDKK